MLQMSLLRASTSSLPQFRAATREYGPSRPRTPATITCRISPMTTAYLGTPPSSTSMGPSQLSPLSEPRSGRRGRCYRSCPHACGRFGTHQSTLLLQASDPAAIAVRSWMSLKKKSPTHFLPGYFRRLFLINLPNRWLELGRHAPSENQPQPRPLLRCFSVELSSRAACSFPPFESSALHVPSVKGQGHSSSSRPHPASHYFTARSVSLWSKYPGKPSHAAIDSPWPSHSFLFLPSSSRTAVVPKPLTP